MHKYSEALSRRWDRAARAQPDSRIAVRLVVACLLAGSAATAALENADGAAVRAALRCVSLLGPCSAALQGCARVGNLASTTLLLGCAPRLLASLLVLACKRGADAEMAALVSPGSLLAFFSAFAAAHACECKSDGALLRAACGKMHTPCVATPLAAVCMVQGHVAAANRLTAFRPGLLPLAPQAPGCWDSEAPTWQMRSQFFGASPLLARTRQPLRPTPACRRAWLTPLNPTWCVPRW